MNIKNLYYKYIKFPISDFFNYKSHIYIDFNIWKVFSDYLKCRKYFHSPLLKKYKLKVEDYINDNYFFLETSTYNKLLYIKCHGIGYKLKYNMFRFENVPFICIIWRNKVKYVFGLEAPLYDEINGIYSKNNLLYYEGILNFLYKNNKDIYKTYSRLKFVQSYWLDKEIYHKDTAEVKLIYSTLLPCIRKKYADKIIELEYKNNKR